MSNQWDYYSMVGFAPEANPPEELERLSIDPDETALFLDFDGTLVDIAPTPDSIRIGASLRSLLKDLVHRHKGAVCIVSGRNLHEISGRLGDFAGTISGGHGAEIRHPSGQLPGIDCDLARLDHIKNAVREFAVLEPRLLAEDKSFGIVLHFRQHPDLECKVRDFLTSLIGDDDEFELQSAKMAVEIKPIGISKAAAVERTVEFAEFAGRRILFAGDDETDESAFSWVNERDGITIKIGEGPTCAHYRAHSPAAFKTWLRMQTKTTGL
jgi:trehalose 6-phosphate phosphatase